MTIRWYFDFISPFAYLQWPRVAELAGSHAVELRPVLLAGLLGHHGTTGPAELPSKRLFTYRHVLWRAARSGRLLRFPPAHPFNPLAALRLCAHAGSSVEAVDAIFRHIWEHGRAGDSAEALAPAARSLGLDMDAAFADEAAKATLRDNFAQAVADGVFGVPTLVHAGRLFWGEDASAMFEDHLAGDPLFGSEAWNALETLPIGAARPATVSRR